VSWHKSKILLVSAVTLVAAGCGGSSPVAGPSRSTTASPQSATNTPSLPSPGSFSGPVMLLCDTAVDGATPSAGTPLFKLDLKTHQLVPFVTFPIGKCGADLTFYAPRGLSGTTLDWGKSFGGQRFRTAFSPDFQKVAVDMFKVKNQQHAGYYDMKSSTYIDVTAIVTPPGNDFSRDPQQASVSFTADGLFMFVDGASGTYKYFDTNLQKVVKETKDPESPKFFALTAVPNITLETGKVYRSCDGMWVIDGSTYLSSNGFLGRRTISPAPHEDDCGQPDPNNPIGVQRLAPPIHIDDTVSDPSGSTVLFIITGKDNTEKLYQANLANPDQPTEITLLGQPLGRFEQKAFQFLDWA
jgi:hypothetical protein